MGQTQPQVQTQQRDGSNSSNYGNYLQNKEILDNAKKFASQMGHTTTGSQLRDLSLSGRSKTPTESFSKAGSNLRQLNNIYSIDPQVEAFESALATE